MIKTEKLYVIETKEVCVTLHCKKGVILRLWRSQSKIFGKKERKKERKSSRNNKRKKAIKRVRKKRKTKNK